jgi:hypothetical protein
MRIEDEEIVGFTNANRSGELADGFFETFILKASFRIEGRTFH